MVVGPALSSKNVMNSWEEGPGGGGSGPWHGVGHWVSKSLSFKRKEEKNNPKVEKNSRSAVGTTPLF